MLGSQVDAATAAWSTEMERTYGSLIQREGKAGAERFFPRVTKSEKKRGGKTPSTAPSAPVG